MENLSRDEFFQSIYEDYYNRVLSYIRGRVNNPQDAEDLASDVFFKCYKNIDRYDPKKASVSTWVFTITSNTLKNYYRDNRATVSMDGMEGFEIPFEEDFDQAVRLEEIRQYLDRVLEDLDEKNRKVLLMRYYDEMKTADIAEEMDLSPGHVRVMLSRTLHRLNIRVKDSDILRLL